MREREATSVALRPRRPRSDPLKDSMPPADPEAWMWERAFELLERADQLHRRFFRPGRPCSHLPTWQPPLDLFETETDYWIVAALPGVAPEGLEVTLEGKVLTIRGERSLPPEARHAVIHRLEVPYGRFERRIELPPGSLELDRRELAWGCLILTLKKR